MTWGLVCLVLAVAAFVIGSSLRARALPWCPPPRLAAHLAWCRTVAETIPPLLTFIATTDEGVHPMRLHRILPEQLGGVGEARLDNGATWWFLSCGCRWWQVEGWCDGEGSIRNFLPWCSSLADPEGHARDDGERFCCALFQFPPWLDVSVLKGGVDTRPADAWAANQ